MYILRRVLFTSLLYSVTAFMLNAQAEDIKWRGFVSQGIIQADKSNFVDNHKDVSIRLTEVGINASYKVNSKLRIAGQAVYLNGGNRYTEGVRIDYLFADFQVASNVDWQANIHLGRFKNYHWLYSATRDIPHTRPSIILPQSVYFDQFRDVALGSDGIALVGSTTNRLGEWDINWSFGRSSISDKQARNLLGDNALGDLKQKFTHQANLVWRPTSGVFNISLGFLDSDFEYDKSEQDTLFDGTADVQRIMIHSIYDSKNWQLAFEIFKERTIYRGLIAPGFLNDSTSEGGYAQFRYFINSDLTVMTRLDLFDLDRKDRDGKIRQAQFGGFVPAYFGFQDQATVGLSWDFTEDWRISAEAHRVKGAGRLAPLLMPDVAANNSKYWNIYALQLMHWF